MLEIGGVELVLEKTFDGLLGRHCLIDCGSPSGYDFGGVKVKVTCDTVTIWLSEHGGKHGSMAWKDLGKLCELDEGCGLCVVDVKWKWWT